MVKNLNTTKNRTPKDQPLKEMRHVEFRQLRNGLCQFFIMFVALSLLSNCSKDNSDKGSTGKKTKETVEIDLSQKFQTIQHFGASDAWTCQFVGKWPDEKRNQVADWLFSTKTDAQGKPEGIGLSLWRFNIGAGSAAQNNIDDEWRRTEGFLNNDGTYDWNKQAGERWFIQAAKARGVEKLLAFTNSPPVQMTINGKGFSSNGTKANISQENYTRFCKFLVDVVKHFQEEEKVKIDYLSPFNEPQWDWTGNGQEGTPFTNREMYDITKKLDSTITAEKLPVKITLGEAGILVYLYEDRDKPGRGSQVDFFFDQSSPNFVGNFPSVEKVISGHSYFTAAPLATMVLVRENVKKKLAGKPIDFWQSEYCILGDQEEIKGGGKDRGINTALYVARLIHHDLSIADAAAWHWWLAVTAYDYKDGLIYVDKSKTDGKVEDTKLLWALGNYSRFITPGSVRVGVNADSTNDLMISSYVNEATKKIITVVVNYSQADHSVNLNVKGAELTSWQPYITSGTQGDDLKPLEKSEADHSMIIPKRSVVTLVGDYTL